MIETQLTTSIVTYLFLRPPVCHPAVSMGSLPGLVTSVPPPGLHLPGLASISHPGLILHR